MEKIELYNERKSLVKALVLFTVFTVTGIFLSLVAKDASARITGIGMAVFFGLGMIMSLVKLNHSKPAVTISFSEIHIDNGINRKQLNWESIYHVEIKDSVDQKLLMLEYQEGSSQKKYHVALNTLEVNQEDFLKLCQSMIKGDNREKLMAFKNWSA